MEGHTKISTLYGVDQYENSKIELDYCENANALVLRCKAWIHLDHKGINELIKSLEHVRDHHLRQVTK